MIPDGVGVSSGQSSPDRVSSNASSERAGIIAGHQKSGKDGVLAIALQVHHSGSRLNLAGFLNGPLTQSVSSSSSAATYRGTEDRSDTYSLTFSPLLVSM